MGRVADDSASEQAEVTRGYDRMARIYDMNGAPMELTGTKKRCRARSGCWHGYEPPLLRGGH